MSIHTVTNSLSTCTISTSTSYFLPYLLYCINFPIYLYLIYYSIYVYRIYLSSSTCLTSFYRLTILPYLPVLHQLYLPVPYLPPCQSVLQILPYLRVPYLPLTIYLRLTSSSHREVSLVFVSRSSVVVAACTTGHD